MLGWSGDLSWQSKLKATYTKRPLGELVRWPEYPIGGNFQARVKKIPSPVLRQSTGLRPGPSRGCSHIGYGAGVYWWGRG